MAKPRRQTGRVTPKGGQSKPAPTPRSAPASPPQVGRRPSNPGFLLLVALAWIVVGIVVFITVSASWKFIPALFAIGVGLFFLRGAAATVARRADRTR